MSTSTTPVNLRPLHATLLSVEAANSLEAHILDGQFPAGTQFTEGYLAEGFDIARQTAKAAINLLIGRNLLTRTANHPAQLVHVDDQALSEIAAMRHVFEVSSLEDLVSDVADGSRPRPLLYSLAAQVLQLETGDAPSRRAVIDHEIDFHRQLIGLTGNTILGRSYASYSHELHLGLISLEKTLDPLVLVEQHLGIVEALDQGLRGGNAEPAASAMQAHLDCLAAI